MMKTLKAVLTDATLRNKVLIVLALLAVTRFIAAVPLPGVDSAKLADFLKNNQLFEYLSLFSGSGFSTFSIALLGLGPYITASILVQVSTMIFPEIKKQMHEEGEQGRRKITQYTRMLTIPFAYLSGFGLLKILSNQGIYTETGLAATFVTLTVVTATTMIMLFIGEKITEYGVGNGVSLIIFSGIVSGIPGTISKLATTFDPSYIPLYIGAFFLAIFIILAVVYMNEAERKIPITHARAHGMGESLDTYLPVKINQAGMIPIIFAVAIFTMPQFAAQIMATSSNSMLASVGDAIQTFFATTWAYMIVYFALVFLFTYFYTSVVVEPDEMAKNLHKRGAYIPGIRPGDSTADYIGNIVNKTTFVGATFLGLVAVIPLALQSYSGVSAIAIGGTSILITVATALEIYKKLESQATLLEY